MVASHCGSPRVCVQVRLTPQGERHDHGHRVMMTTMTILTSARSASTHNYRRVHSPQHALNTFIAREHAYSRPYTAHCKSFHVQPLTWQIILISLHTSCVKPHTYTTLCVKAKQLYRHDTRQVCILHTSFPPLPSSCNSDKSCDRRPSTLEHSCLRFSIDNFHY